MTKKEFIRLVAGKYNRTLKDTEFFFTAMFESIVEQVLNGEVVKVYGFGTFKLQDVKERKCAHPKTLEPMIIPAREKVKFIPCGEFKKHMYKTMGVTK